MSVSVDLQELAIVLTAKNHNPSILNPDFLKCSGIIPSEWELARQPLYAQQVTQLVFRNGVNLIAQADRLMFVEGMQSKSLQDLAIAPLAQKYMQALPHADYQAVGINIRGFVPFNQNADAAHQYLMNTLLARGSWQDFGDAPVRTSLNVAYTLGQKRLFLSIAEATLQLPEGETTPILMFSGNFEFAPGAETLAGDRLMQLSQAIENWQQDVETYQDLINTRFLHREHTATVLSTSELLVLSA